MFCVYSFRGPDMESSTQTELGQYCLRLNNAFMRLGTGFTIYLEAQRRISSSYDASLMPTPLLQQWEDDRRDYYESSAHYESEYYLILSHVPPATTRSKIQQYFISESTAQKDRDVDTRAFIKLVDNFWQTATWSRIFSVNFWAISKNYRPKKRSGICITLSPTMICPFVTIPINIFVTTSLIAACFAAGNPVLAKNGSKSSLSGHLPHLQSQECSMP